MELVRSNSATTSSGLSQPPTHDLDLDLAPRILFILSVDCLFLIKQFLETQKRLKVPPIW